MTTISLEIRYPDRPAEVRQFSQPKITIGRDSGHIVLGDPQASSQHAEINVTQTHVTYVDLNSTNGSYQSDGQRITQPIALYAGTEIRIGSSALVLTAVQTGQLGPRGTLVMPQMGGPIGQDDPLAATALAGSPAGSPAVGDDIPPPSGAAQQALVAHESQPPPPVYPQQGAVPPAQGFQQPVQGYPQPGYQAPAPGMPYQAQGGYMPPPGAPGYGMPHPGQVPPPGGFPPPGAVPQGVFPPGAAPPGGFVPPGQPYPGQPPGGFPPGAPAGAQPGAMPGAMVTTGKSDPIAFTKECIAAYQPHLIEATKVIGIIALPLGVLNAVGSYIPILGWLLSLIGGLGYALAYFFFGLGAQAEYAMRLAAGAPASAGAAWKIQLGRMFPWTFGLLVPLLIASVGCLITYVLFGLFLLPAYMIENKRMFDANKRTLELAGKDWGLALIPVLVVAIPAMIASGIVSVILGFIPYVGGALAAVWGPLFSAALTPLITFIQFRVYYRMRLQHEGVDAAAIVRQQAGAPGQPVPVQ